jgi:hypothetical protein
MSLERTPGQYKQRSCFSTPVHVLDVSLRQQVATRQNNSGVCLQGQMRRIWEASASSICLGSYHYVSEAIPLRTDQ